MEKGRSLSELGHTLRWSDLNAFLIHLPPSSHTRAQLAPELTEEHNRVEQWTRPDMLLMGNFYDAWERNALLRQGIPPENLPTKGIITRHLEHITGTTPQPTQQEKPQAPTPADIIRTVKARETPATTD